MRALPIRFRLTLWYSGMLAAAMIAFSVTVYLIVTRTLLGNLDSSLTQRMDHLQREVAVINGRLSLPHVEEEIDQPLIPAVLLDPSRHVLLGTLPIVARAWLAHHSFTARSDTGATDTGGIRLLVRSVVRGGRVRGYVLVYESTRAADAARDSLLLVLIAAGPLLLIVAGAGGIILARRALRPVADMTHAAEAISASVLERRLPVGSTGDELSELARTFNAMIDRLQAAVRREKNFTADASHELRSPLAVIRAEATLTLEHHRPESVYRQALATIDDQATAMEELIAALLMLARVEVTAGFERGPLDVGHLMGMSIQQARRSVPRPEATVTCDAASGLLVLGSEPLLSRAIGNVVENALKVSRPGDVIDVAARREGEWITITVHDQGPGISLQHQQAIFEPFYQIETARTPGASHGLGLAICRRMVDLHGGRVGVTSEPGAGSTFVIYLPASAAEERILHP